MSVRKILLAFLASFVLVMSVHADQVVYQPGPIPGTDVWITNVYSYDSDYGVDDDKLQAGGWGDWYHFLIKLDLAGLPQNATSAGLWMVPFGDPSKFVGMPIDLMTTDWNENTGWYNTVLNGTQVGTLPAPTLGYWYGINFTGIYNGWKAGTYPNYGFRFRASGNNNQFTQFRSSDYSYAPHRPKLVVTYNGANLGFPLDCSTPACSGTGNITYTAGAYTAGSVVSVVDHSMTNVYASEDGIVTAWNGEKGQGVAVNQGCYPKVGGGTFSISGTYVGSSPSFINCLNYDSHPGYDYKAAYGTPVKAAAAGTVVNFNSTGQGCIPKGLPAGCVAWGAVGIGHGNGYVTQYLHLSTILVSSGAVITKGQVIGYSGNTAPVSLGAHLHFETLKQVSGSSGTSVNDYKVVDPYGWTASDADPLEAVTGIKNVCLWETCQWW